MSIIVLLFYAIPACICLISDVHKTVQDIKTDIRKRSEAYYSPEVTIGRLLGKLLLTLIPVVNIIKALMYLLTDFAEIVISFVDKVLSTPLVPKKKN